MLSTSATWVRFSVAEPHHLSISGHAAVVAHREELTIRIYNHALWGFGKKKQKTKKPWYILPKGSLKICGVWGGSSNDVLVGPAKRAVILEFVAAQVVLRI